MNNQILTLDCERQHQITKEENDIVISYID